MSHDQISGIHDLSIQLSHKLSSFAHPLVVFLPFFSHFPFGLFSHSHGESEECFYAAKWLQD